MSSNQRRHSLKKTVAVLFILSLLASPCQAADSANPLTVTRCIDGDTLQLSNGEKVRLIGMEIPSKLAKEAAEFTRKLVEGKKVYMEYDMRPRDKYNRRLAYMFLTEGVSSEINEDVIERKPFLNLDLHDSRGNLKGALVFVNATLVKAGYAQVMTPAYDAATASKSAGQAGQAVPPNVKYQELFLKLQKEARENRRGLWK
jgi:micrococcal nuclease